MNSIRHKTSRAFYLLATFIVLLCLFAFFNLLYLQQQVREGVVIGNFKDDILEMRRHEKNLFLYHNKEELESILVFTREAIHNLEQNHASYASLWSKIDLNNLQTLLAEYQVLLTRYWSQWEQQKNENLSGKIRPLGHQLSTIADHFASQERKSLLQSLNTTQWTLVSAIFITALITLVIGYRLSRLVVRPLRELENRLQPIAQGQFEQLEIISDEQEIINFTNAFNKMLYELDLRKKRLLHTEKLASLGVLISGVAHELNNPLGNILSSCQLLKEEIDSTDRQLLISWLEQIDSETMRAHKIVNALKDFGRHRDFIIEPVQLVELVDNTLLLLANELKHLPPILTDIPDKLFINVDRQRFQQVLINLINNATDAGDSHNQIELKASFCWDNSNALPDNAYIIGDVKKPLQASIPDMAYTSLSIKDTGVGIDEQSIVHIFDPFYTTKAPGKGMGIGLYIVQEIIREHAGEIGVISQPDKGAEFIIRLPCTQALQS
ncbi:sensor histidine kinase [sulfur-oxidizing endosymbiont of Gigantopelta aegis]|uniref:sensor histidine kinase n=1 Tax=sulfur-oxidizing endosymbiont of Gigantopelta aegis TaxID=2794934 RepID=UPI0018DEB6E9|nr:HAMP domain-containing sensor histidine kinase [sulfur-oxidizing endosymbiont of Gigantopelta aegis]